ncbi:MAG TPA: response regulator [Isosphaeraceae bacterium]|jgi:DNA-binding response OmpR family regulator
MDRHKRILIVDDEPNVRLVFRTALATLGAEIAVAEDGETALERLERQSFDLVLLDLKMPHVDGMETLRRLRERGDDTPVVIVTAHGDVPHAVEAMKLGAIDFLSKPLAPTMLRKVAAEVLARHSDTESELEPAEARHSGSVVVALAPAALDLSSAKRALNLREFEHAAELLGKALAIAPDSPEALTLTGVLYEARGQEHAAYRVYRAALEADPHYGPALENLRRYCDHHGLDFRNKAINPAADL